ncbi:LysE family translocator [Luteimonas sp. R10]|uniref:LysE family translocator n=1 Tax=Luteimonas sp. R10 TaxID=3108176 RepID=UPI003090769E|nr:LysE family translocator [Luteimonas sp. R10]
MTLFDGPTLLAYLAAAVALVLIPGPGTAWIIAQTSAGGARRGMHAALGLEAATTIHALAAGLGLSALLAASALAFELLKYAGAAYLVWLGIQAWRSGERPTVDADAPYARKPRQRRVFLRSVAIGVLNPKVAVFFLAFLPQFVHPERGMVWLQFIVLGLLLSTVGLLYGVSLALLAGRIGRSAGSRFSRWRARALGGVFVALGVRLALQQRS